MMPFATLMSVKVGDVELLTDYAARALTATLEPAAQSVQMERTWNGTLIDLSMPQFRKFNMEITCTDFESIGIIPYPPGTQVTVVCLPDLGIARGVDDSQPLTMTMRIGGWRVSRDEWPARTTWSLPLFEV